MIEKCIYTLSSTLSVKDEVDDTGGKVKELAGELASQAANMLQRFWLALGALLKNNLEEPCGPTLDLSIFLILLVGLFWGYKAGFFKQGLFLLYFGPFFSLSQMLGKSVWPYIKLYLGQGLMEENLANSLTFFIGIMLLTIGFLLIERFTNIIFSLPIFAQINSLLGCMLSFWVVIMILSILIVSLENHPILMICKEKMIFYAPLHTIGKALVTSLVGA